MNMRLLSFAMMLPLAGCTVIPATEQVRGTPAPERYQVGIDRPVKVGSVTVTPKRLVEDSRCPIDAECVWAGRVILRTQIDGDGWRETTDLTLGEPYETRGIPVRLISATPTRTTDSEPDETMYRFAFEGEWYVAPG